MEADAGRRLQLEIPPSQIHGLLRAGAGVIEKQQERAISLGVTAVSRQRREERANVLAFQEARLRWRRPFHRDCGNALGQSQAVLVANPIPADQQLDPAVHDAVLEEALALVDSRGITGKAVTPFLLERMRVLTGGESVEVNRALLLHNARLAADLATSLLAE